MILEVIAAAPSVREAALAREGVVGPQPGSVFLARAPGGELYVCAGYLPCGKCGPCQAALHLGCTAPSRPGVGEVQGGAFGRLDLAIHDLAPLLEQSPAKEMAGPLALLAAAGTTYQAAVLAGMVPGDVVLLPGEHPLDTEALPHQLLLAMGLHPVVQTTPGRLPSLAESMPSPRYHLLDLQPDQASVAGWLSLAGGCASCSMVCPELPPLTPELPSLLAGQTAPRWVRDLHPHLVLDVLALARRLDLDKRTSICAPADLSALLADLDPLAGKPWPVALIEAE